MIPNLICLILCYLDRTIHAYIVDSARGVQLYMQCIWVTIPSNGSIKILAGVDFKTPADQQDWSPKT